MKPHRSPRDWSWILGAALLGLACAATADEAAIRRNLAERLTDLPPIDQVTPLAIKGLWEVRMGPQVIYSDSEGHFVFQGELLETRTGRNLTADRIEQLTAIDFRKLPLKDAVVWKQGTGARKLVVFADPNCGYCRRFERELSDVPDITVYTFLIPILGGDSPQKAQAVWCARDRGKVWRDWMVNGKPLPESGACDITALQRNLALRQRHAINGTPLLVFEDSRRVTGLLGAAEIRKRLQAKPSS